MALDPSGDIPDTGIPANLSVDMSMAEQYEWHRDYLRRRPVSRRSMLLGSASATAAAMLAACSTPGSEPPAPGSLLVGGRHVGYGADAASQLRFSAQLSRKPDGARIFLDHGPTRALGASVEAEVRDLFTQVPQQDGGILAAEQYYVHVPVDGLPARAPHFYRWRTSDGFVGDVRSAQTAMSANRAAATPFRFTMMGDQGSDMTPTRPAGLAPGDYDDKYYKADNGPTVSHATNVQRQIVASNPDFHVLAGDISYAVTTGSGKPLQYVPHKLGSSAPSGYDKPSKGFDKFNPYVWDSYFGAIESSASTTPWMFTTGNHDMEAVYGNHGYGGHLARLDFPGNGPRNCPSVYSFRYGNVAVLSLDANDVTFEPSVKANFGYSGGAQTDWVQRTLAGYRADPSVDFIVCFFHECAYSTTKDHASDGGVREAWAKLFDRYQVDLVLQGHNHVYERTDPIRAGRATKESGDNSIVYPATDGTVYYTVGGGGRPRYPFQDGEQESYRGHEVADNTVPNSYSWTSDGHKNPESVTWSRVRFRNYSFIRVDVRPGVFSSEMDVIAVDEYGREFDKVTYRRTVAGHTTG